MSKLTCQIVATESLLMLKANLAFSAAPTAFMKPTMRSASIEAIGAWRAEAIIGPAPTLTIRRQPRYTTGCEWMA